MSGGSASALNAVAQAIEDVAGRLSLATSARDIEDAVDKLMTIAGNARRGLGGGSPSLTGHPQFYVQDGTVPAQFGVRSVYRPVRPEDVTDELVEKAIRGQYYYELGPHAQWQVRAQMTGMRKSLEAVFSS